MYITEFLDKYKKDLNSRINDISISLTSGSASDIGHYKAMVGEIQGLTYALEQIQTLLKGWMMSLIVPDYVLAQRNAKKKAEEQAKKLKLIERIPQPTGWRILVMPYIGKEKTEGGIYVPDPVREREARATVTAYVAKVGPLAYKDIDKFGEDGAWCKEGDWVCIGRYAGSRFQIEGGEVRIINDDEVIATIVDPDDIKSYGA